MSFAKTLTSFTDLHKQRSTFAYVYPDKRRDTIQFQDSGTLEDGLHSPIHRTWDGAYNVSIPSVLRPEPAHISRQVVEDPLYEFQAYGKTEYLAKGLRKPIDLELNAADIA